MGQAKMVTHEHEGTAADAAAERHARKERQERLRKQAQKKWKLIPAAQKACSQGAR